MRDQWVFNKNDCHKDYAFVKNTGNAEALTNFKSGDLNTRECFQLMDWKVKDLTERYTGAFKGCNKIKNGTDGDGNDLYDDFEEFTINFYKEAYEFISKIKTSLRNNFEFFSELQEMYRIVNKTTFELSTALDRESRYVDKLSESLLVFN